MYKVINTRLDPIYGKREEFEYIYTPHAPSVSPFASKFIGEWLKDNLIQELQRRDIFAKDIQIRTCFIGAFKPNLKEQDIQYHYLILNKRNFTRGTCFLMVATQSLYRPDVFEWSFSPIDQDHEISFTMKGFEFEYEELLEFYFLNPKNTTACDNFYDFLMDYEDLIIMHFSTNR
ncbi:hypothetical protein [Pseudomonas orientalis]|nr:hypothetical protein [Pseudomonas orientalis]